jgi:asparagine synthase (glutamine-hydrolysing)
MCGITGIINKKSPVSLSELRAMCDRLQLRGPDAEGTWVSDHLGLGHRRLSVIDLETGDQPMLSPDENLVLIFNGEIYNFKELRSALIELHHTFVSNSDSEVIIKCYQQYGIKGTLSRLEGMFAFALYDKKTEEVFIARDKFGEKPMYYIQGEDSLYFASELKALESKFDKKKIDKKALNFFLSLSYIPAPYTIYSEVKKLLPAHYIQYKKGGAIQFHKYYDLRERIAHQPYHTDFKSACEGLRTLLKDSVAKRMVSDVPLGAFLSGGIDSSIIASLMAEISDQPINTFSIGFTEKSYDESERAQLIADKIKSNHTVHFLDYKDVVEIVDDIVLHYDEPFGDSSALPSYYVAKLAREKVTVVLTGDCADELFGGYEKYLGQHYISRFKKKPKLFQWLVKTLVNITPHTRLTNSILRRAKKVLSNVDESDAAIHYNLMCLGFNDKERSQLLKEDYLEEIKSEVIAVYDSFDTEESLEKGFYTDLHFVLEGDMLAKVDRVCMKNSLEARVPFLDSKIVELAYRLPLDFKIRGNNKKFILKEAFKDLLPPETVNFRKKGFGVPVDYWFRHELKEEITKLLSKELIAQQGIFNFEIVQNLLKEHQSGKENHKGKLWNLFVFQKWYLKHIEEA